MNTNNIQKSIALTLFFGAGLTYINILTTPFTQASSSSDYQLVEDNFASTQSNGSALNIISESGFEDIQYISEGSDTTIQPTTPTPLPTTSTTPIPTQATSTSSSGGGGGGTDPIVLEKIRKGTTNTPLPTTETTHNSSTETPTSTPIPTKIPIKTSTPLPAPTHLPRSTPPTTDIDQQNTTQTNRNYYNNTDRLGDITRDTKDTTENIIQKEKEKERESRADNEETQNIKQNIKNPDTGDPMFHNSAILQRMQNTEKQEEKNTKFFCTASSFTTYALLLIMFLLGMIFQSILYKTFYTNKK